MTRYLISFPSDAMDHIPDEEGPDVAEAAHAVVREAQDAGVWVFGGGLDEDVIPSWWPVTGRSPPAPTRWGHQHRRRALTGSSLGVGREDRRRLPLSAGGQRVLGRPARLTDPAV